MWTIKPLTAYSLCWSNAPGNTRTSKHAECGGQTGYTVHKVDDTIDAFVRSILEKVRGINREEVIKAQNKTEIEARKRHIKELSQDCEKAESELRRLQSEIIKSLTGESVFTPEMLKPVIEAQERKYAGLKKALREAESELRDSENNFTALAEKFDTVLEWAAMYDNAEIAAKKMIVSRIIDRVDLNAGYDINIKLNISIEQFLNTIELCA